MSISLKALAEAFGGKLPTPEQQAEAFGIKLTDIKEDNK